MLDSLTFTTLIEYKYFESNFNYFCIGQNVERVTTHGFQPIDFVETNYRSQLEIVSKRLLLEKINSWEHQMMKHQQLQNEIAQRHDLHQRYREQVADIIGEKCKSDNGDKDHACNAASLGTILKSAQKQNGYKCISSFALNVQ